MFVLYWHNLWQVWVVYIIMRNISTTLRTSLLALFALPFLLGSFALPDGNDQGVNFIDDDYGAAVDKAKATDKLVYVFVYGTNCNASHKMMDVAFEDEDVAEFYNKNFVNVKLNADDLKNNLRITAWGVKGVPTHVFLNSKRKVVLMASGYANPDGIIATGKEAIEDAR